ncbi:GNAT family N-acetyltransferase [Glaciecola petra]|uniref:GNAT family N-acetyltransferase n=1 Tax=Glaciecola petra TaxID=3075602 RepID=A0ABU2ZU03_9ALTE|nr:GNAT family N-acetyltransferase [Aestuariibacter sp. P117]MDT0596116.1 GNAT family N-acetyltransferase [Aestuariibacter sp. P117]
MNENELTIVDYSPELAHYFYTINKEWIDDMFVLESIDEQVLSNPQMYVIDAGGYIWFVKHARLGIVGACALVNKGKGWFELTKMGVSSDVRGLKIGEKLLHHVLEFCQMPHIHEVFLLTNKKCEAAIHLYEKLGFEHSKLIMQKYGKSYERCDVAMYFNKQIGQGEG